jgi:hypothetical protein
VTDLEELEKNRSPNKKPNKKRSLLSVKNDGTYERRNT